MKIIILIIPSFLLINSCNEPGHHVNIYPEQSGGADTFVSDVPRRFQDTSYTKKVEGIEQEIGLASLKNGFDSLEIRLWFEYAFKDSVQLIILRNENLEWKGYILDLQFKYGENDSLICITKVTSEMKPKSGWQKFINELLGLNIQRLTDFRSIQGYDTGTDGDFITVELSSPKMYRIYSYQGPLGYQDKIPQANDIEKIMDLIEEEVPFRRLRKF